MLSRIRLRLQEALGLTRAESGILLFLTLGLLAGGTIKIFKLDKVTEHYDFSQSDSIFAAASAKVDSIVAADEDTVSGRSKSTAKSKLADGVQISLNVGGIEDLTLLPGIGKVTAQRIIDYRNANGRFHSVDELRNVKGIGGKKLEKIRPFIKVD